MADAAGSRRPSQPSTPVSPAGVGASASNRGSPRAMVSPSILQEILESGDQGLIDDALEQWDTTAMGQLLSTLPSPTRGASPAGVGSAASNRSSPSPAAAPPPPQTPTGAVAVTAGVGAGGSGGGSSGGSSSSGSSRSQRSSPSSGGASGRRSGTPTSPAPAPAPVAASTPRGRPTQAQKEPRRGLGGRGRGRGRGGRPARPNPSPTVPWSPASPSQQGSPLNQADLQRRLRMLLQDQEAIAAGRRIANITTTNSIVTSYKEGGRPSVQSNSSRFSP